VAVAQAAPPRPRASGGRLFIIVGAVLALVGFGAAVALGSLGGSKGGSSVSGPTVLAVYAAKDISLRTTITSSDQVTVKAVPGSVLSGDAITIDGSLANQSTAKQQDAAFKQTKDLIAEVNIKAGTPLLASMLAKSGDIVSGLQAAYLPIPQGYVAFTMPTSEQIGVAGYIQPGDYISVVAQAGTQQTAAVVTVFPNLRVLRVGPANLQVTGAGGNQTQAAASPGANASSITVVVTPCQAELLKWLQTQTQLSYELESYKDYQPAPTGPDASCASVNSTKGITAQDITSRYPQFTKVFGGH
jgi:pilus assembly protein CpaB